MAKRKTKYHKVKNRGGSKPRGLEAQLGPLTPKERREFEQMMNQLRGAVKEATNYPKNYTVELNRFAVEAKLSMTTVKNLIDGKTVNPQLLTVKKVADRLGFGMTLILAFQVTNKPVTQEFARSSAAELKAARRKRIAAKKKKASVRG